MTWSPARSKTSLALVIASVAAFAIAAAASCSPFDAGTTPALVDGSTPSDPTDASTSGDSAQTSDGSVVDGATSACPNGATPLVDIIDSFQGPNPPYDSVTVVTGALSIDTARGAPRVIGTAVPPTTTGGGARAFIAHAWPATVPPTSISVELDMVASYTKMKVYAEGGCRIQLSGASNEKSTATLIFAEGSLQLGGHHDNGSDNNWRGMPELGNPFVPTPRHVRLNVAIGTKASAASVAIDNTSQATGTFNTSFPLTTFEVACGIIYTDHSDQGTLSIEASSVHVVACP